MRSRALLIVLFAAVAAACSSHGSPSSVVAPFSSYAIASPAPAPTWSSTIAYSGSVASMVAGHDGAMWGALADGRLTRIDPLGNQSFYTLGGTALGPITPNPDGNVYVAESLNGGAGIAQVTPQGQVTDFALPGTDTISSIVTGSDGAVWMIRPDSPTNSPIGRMTTTGAYTEYADTVGFGLQNLMRGSDKNLWSSNLVRISIIDGSMTYFPGPGATFQTEGSDGMLWQVDTLDAYSVDMNGNVTAYPIARKQRYTPQVATAHRIWFVGGYATPALHAFSTSLHKMLGVNVPIPGGLVGTPSVGVDKMIWVAVPGTIYRWPFR